MAKPEQTEKATPKRRKEAREGGQVARSPDVSSAAIFLAIIITLHTGFSHAIDAAASSFTIAIGNAGDPRPLDLHTTAVLFWRAGLPYAALIAMMFGSALVIGILANVLQFGFLFAPKLLAPNLGKLNPLSGFQRIFLSPQTAITFGKQLLKLTVVVFVCWMAIKDNLTMIYAGAHASPRDVVMAVEGIVFGIGVRVGVLLLVLGLADFFWEKRRLDESLKMTKTEVKDEHRQAEGNPESKSALKGRQRAMARRRMMAAVPKATVVVTNPTHFAVALQWDELTMDAPILSAKGADLIARRIREIAAEHGVPIMENAPLARALYAKVELDSPVPPDLYSAVAQVIAFVYRLKSRGVAS